MPDFDRDVIFYHGILTSLWSSSESAPSQALQLKPAKRKQINKFPSPLSSISPDEIIEPSGSQPSFMDFFAILRHNMEAVQDLDKRVKRLENAFIASYEIHDLGTPELELQSPIKVIIEMDDDGEYLISFPDAYIYGTAEGLEEAMDDLKSDIVRLFNRYHDKPDEKLGPKPKKIKRLLNRLISIVQ